MIISCPSCKTDYSVSDSVVQDIEDPRFHCAICDHYFELSKETLASARLSENKGQQDTLSTNSYLQHRDSSSTANQQHFAEQIINKTPVESAKHSEKRIKTSLSSRLFKHANIFHRATNQIKKTNHQEDSQIIPSKENVPGSGSWRLSDSYGTSTRISSDGHYSSEAANSHAPQIINRTSETSGSHRTPSHSNWRNVIPASNSNAVTKIAEWPTPPPPPEGMIKNDATASNNNATSSRWTLDSPEKGRSIKDTLSAKISSIVDFPKQFIRKPKNKYSWLNRVKNRSQILNTPARSQGRGKIRFNINALLFLSIPALALAGILYWNNQIDTAEVPLSGILSSNKDQIPQVPPVELELVNVNSQVITLDDGKKVIIVSGKVFNSSSVAYKDVKVEASLFDKNNRTIQTLVVPLKNGLSGPSKINSLKVDAINALQKKEMNLDQELKPTQSLPFKVVFTSHIDSASYFSSRVFSVKNPTAKTK